MNNISVFNVARYMIEKMHSMTTMKLQKMTYYAQAWSLAWDGVPLFNEEFQAWANGPVCVDLYEKHRGIFEVDESFLSDYHSDDFTKDQIETMDVVIREYGSETPYALSSMTHQERPWIEARAGVPSGERSDHIISKEIMQDYYSSQIAVS